MSTPWPPGLPVLRDQRVTRRPFWLDTGQAQVAAWLHHPTNRHVRDGAVVLCPSLGFEYTHAHRSFLHLADHLAGSGFVTLRFDYPGTGDSSGDEATPGLPHHWLSAIDAALDFSEDLSGGPASLIGFRIGGALATRVAVGREVRGLALWAPVTNGKAFSRELHALKMLGRKSGTQPEDDFVEAGGFRYAPETIEFLRSLDLNDLAPRARTVLVVDGADRPMGTDLVRSLRSRAIPTALIEQAEYPAMIAEPQYTRVPTSTIEDVVTWLEGVTGPPDIRLSEEEIAAVTGRRSADFSIGDDLACTESLTLVPSNRGPDLFAVSTRAPRQDGPRRPVVVMLNSGSVHHVGPHRLYVQWARALARAGIDSLRVDLRNLGDSRIGRHEDENHPYPETATIDAEAVAAWLVERADYPSCILAGLCSGAHNAFRAGLEVADSVSGLVCLNPLTFRFERGMSLDTPDSVQTMRDARYYAQALRDPARWRKLLTGQSDVRYILGFLARRAVQLVLRAVQTAGGILHLSPAGRLATELDELARRGRRILFVFSSEDPGHELLRSEAGSTLARLERTRAVGIATIEDADHTFSENALRVAVIQATLGGLTASEVFGQEESSR